MDIVVNTGYCGQYWVLGSILGTEYWVLGLILSIGYWVLTLGDNVYWLLDTWGHCMDTAILMLILGIGYCDTWVNAEYWIPEDTIWMLQYWG